MNESEVYERMCKKIAQLTRVIFILNTKNDENESLIESFVETYEKEIENITKEANFVISNMKKAITQMKDNINVDDKLKEITRKYEDTCLAYGNDYDRYKKEIMNREKKITDDYTEKVDKMYRDLADLKKIYDTKYSELNKKSEDEKKALINDKETIKKELNNEIENIKKTFTDKTQKTNEEVKSREEKTKIENEKEKKLIKDEYDKKISDYQKLLENSSNSNGKQAEEMKNDYEKKIKQLNSEKDELLKKINELRAEIENIKNIIKGKNLKFI